MEHQLQQCRFSNAVVSPEKSRASGATAKQKGAYKFQSDAKMQARVFSHGGDHLKDLQGSSKVEEGWRWQGCSYKGLSGYAAIAESCRKTLPGVRRHGDTKVEIVEVGMVLSNLVRPQKESGCCLRETGTGVVLGLG